MMETSDFEKIRNALSSGAIIAIAIGSIFGLALCIGSIMVVICIMKQCHRSRHTETQEMMQRRQQQQPYLYPHSWTAQYPPNTTSVANYPPPYESAPPPYVASTSEFTKVPYR